MRRLSGEATRLASLAAVGALMGAMLSANVSALTLPLGFWATDFASRDDAVPLDVRRVLTAPDAARSTMSILDGTLAAVVSVERSAVAIALAGLRPAHGEHGREQLGVMLNCDPEPVIIGLFSDGFFTASQPQGWSNSVAVEIPDSCSALVIYVHSSTRELLSYQWIPLQRPHPQSPDPSCGGVSLLVNCA